jgi:uridine kinase
MKLAIIISGLLRSFELNYNKILSYFKDYDFDIFLCTSKYNNDNKYLSYNNIKFENYNKIKHILYINDDIILFKDEYNNLSKNWYKWKLISKLVDINEYDLIIKMRPDIHINDIRFNINNIENYENTINIPYQNDIFNNKLFDSYESINDQIAIFNIKLLDKIGSFFDNIQSIKETYGLPYVSEILFYKYLITNNIKINRFELDYKLILSECNIIAICGDSGSGKTTISKLIEPLLPHTELLILETDRYHKWERGNTNYNKYTHLNPYANNLEKMSNDLYNLKIGDNIYTVDYDHDTGKFTNEKKIEHRTNVILCGLHTLYIDKMTSIIDIKVFIDTDRELIKKWKIDRDIKKRGYTEQQVINMIEKREPDYNKYIIGQKENANIIIRFYYKNNDLRLQMKIKKYIIYNIPSFILEQQVIQIDDWIIVDIDKDTNVNWDNILVYIDRIKLYNGLNGFIQRVFYYFLYENKLT